MPIIALAPIIIVFLAMVGLTAWQGLTVQHIKKIYLYLVSLVSLIIIIVGAIMLLNMALKTWVFTKADTDWYSYPRCADIAVAPDGSQTKAPACDEEAEKKRAEENRAAQKQRDAAQALAMIIVSTPVFYYHWRLARKES